MKIERARREDVSAVWTLERATDTAPHWAVGEYRAAVSGGDAGLRRCLFVARGGEELLGFSVGRLVAEAGEIESVAVRFSARRRGVGRALCQGVIAWAWEHGAEAVELEVRAGSVGVRDLYRELGFVEYGRRVGYYSGPADDAVLMRLTRTGVETNGGSL